MILRVPGAFGRSFFKQGSMLAPRGKGRDGRPATGAQGRRAPGADADPETHSRCRTSPWRTSEGRLRRSGRWEGASSILVHGGRSARTLRAARLVWRGRIPSEDGREMARTGRSRSCSPGLRGARSRSARSRPWKCPHRPPVKTSNPRLPPRGADRAAGGIRTWARILAAGPAVHRPYSYCGRCVGQSQDVGPRTNGIAPPWGELRRLFGEKRTHGSLFRASSPATAYIHPHSGRRGEIRRHERGRVRSCPRGGPYG